MGSYYLLNRKVTPQDVFVEGYEADRELEYGYSKGIPIDVREPVKLYYKNGTKRKLDYVSGIQSFPVVSSRFRDIMTRCDEHNLVFYAAKLIGEATGETDDAYFCLNILGNVLCLDWDRGDYEVFPGTENVVLRVRRLAIRQDELRERHIVRIAEIPSLILVSSRLRALAESAQLTGIQFQDIQDVRVI
jgi:hypothetical protein